MAVVVLDMTFLLAHTNTTWGLVYIFDPKYFLFHSTK